MVIVGRLGEGLPVYLFGIFTGHKVGLSSGFNLSVRGLTTMVDWSSRLKDLSKFRKCEEPPEFRECEGVFCNNEREDGVCARL